MASFFNMKGTTQNEFQLGIKGPKILRKTHDSTDHIILPDNIDTKKIILGNGSLTETEYSGNAATATKWKTARNIIFKNVIILNQTENKILFDGSDDITIDIKSINALSLINTIPWASLEGNAGTTDKTFALGNHNHDDKYIQYNYKLQSSDLSNIQLNETSLTKNDNNKVLLNLSIKNGSIVSDMLSDKSVSSSKLALGIIESKHFKTPDAQGGDYSQKILLVDKAKKISMDGFITNNDNTDSISINEIFVVDENQKHLSKVKTAVLADNATSAEKAKTLNSHNIFGQSFNGSSDVKGDITVQNILPDTKTKDAKYNIGQDLNRFDNLYLSENIYAKDGSLTDLTVSNTINANSKTSTEFNSSRKIELTGDIIGSNSSTGKDGWTISTALKKSGVTENTYGNNLKTDLNDLTTNIYLKNNSKFIIPKIIFNDKGIATLAEDQIIQLPKIIDTNTYVSGASWAGANTDQLKLVLSRSGTETTSVETNIIPSASESQSGIITKSNQTIGGIKTFKNGIKIGSSDVIDNIIIGTTNNNIIATQGYIDDKLSQASLDAMEFKGIVESKYDAQSKKWIITPDLSNAKKGNFWKVKSNGDFSAISDDIEFKTIKKGDSLIYDGTKWELIPSGDDIEDTWREIKINSVSLNKSELNLISGDNTSFDNKNGQLTISSTDTKNTTGSTNKDSTQLYLIGAETQDNNKITYSNSNIYITTDNKIHATSTKSDQSDKLSTSRLLWNNSFDGSSDINGDISFGNREDAKIINVLNISGKDSSKGTITGFKSFSGESNTSKKVNNDLTIGTAIKFNGSKAINVNSNNGISINENAEKTSATIGHTNIISKGEYNPTETALSWGDTLALPVIKHDTNGHISETISTHNITLPAKPDYSDTYVSLNKTEDISGIKTFKAPQYISKKEIVTTWFETANGGRVGFGKEGPNDGTGIFFEQKTGTRRLNFRSSATPGAIVWSQPEANSTLYLDVQYIQFRQCGDVTLSKLGNFYPNTNNTGALGYPSHHWNNLYANHGKIYSVPTEDNDIVRYQDLSWRSININGTEFLDSKIPAVAKPLNIINGTATTIESKIEDGSIKINVDLGTAHTQAAYGDHTHTEYSLTDHNHDATYLGINSKIVLDTSSTTTLVPNTSEKLLDNNIETKIQLHKISKTGDYTHLLNKPIQIIEMSGESKLLTSEDIENIENNNKIIYLKYQDRIYRKEKSNIVIPNDATYIIYSSYGDDNTPFQKTKRFYIKINKSTKIASALASNYFSEYKYYESNDILGALKPVSQYSNPGFGYFNEGLIVKSTKTDGGLITNDIFGGNINTGERIVINQDSNANVFINRNKSTSNAYHKNKELILQASTVGNDILSLIPSEDHFDKNNSAITELGFSQYSALRSDKAIDLIRQIRAQINTFGGIKLYSATSFNTLVDNAIISTEANKNYAIQLDKNGRAFVNVPWIKVDETQFAKKSDLNQYVTTNTTQVITGQKEFANNEGIKISNTNQTGGSASMKYNAEEECLEFVFA